MGNNRNARVVFNCNYCGEESSERPSHYKRNKRHFCSQDCYSKYRRDIMPPHEQPSYKGGGMGDKERRRRAKVRSDTSHAVRNGKMFRLSCRVCGESKVEAHHPDYDKPFDVVWLCFKHHRQIHENPELLTQDKS